MTSHECHTFLDRAGSTSTSTCNCFARPENSTGVTTAGSRMPQKLNSATWQFSAMNRSIASKSTVDSSMSTVSASSSMICSKE